MRILFATPYLPQTEVSLAEVKDGRISLSGSQVSILLVADDLASRGHTVGFWILGGQRVVDSSVICYPSIDSALRESWDRIVMASWGDSQLSEILLKSGQHPLLWTQVHVSRGDLSQLEMGELSGIITVSDIARLPLLHSDHASQTAHIYNPINPFFLNKPSTDASRYSSKVAVFCGYLGETKGAHLVLATWPYVRKLLPDARLVMIGSARLYKEGVVTGPLGLADPQFEAKYLQPILAEFGSLNNAGIELTGLSTPYDIRCRYSHSALGLINFNWHSFTETFCCVGAEMLATELPVFSFAAGSLPETMGRTGGAVLCARPELELGAQMIVGLLKDPQKLAVLGSRGHAFVNREYSLNSVTAKWEKVLISVYSDLDYCSGDWHGPKSIRYYIERSIHRMKLGPIYKYILDICRQLVTSVSKVAK
ncbi:MAG: glycosyltransferase family 4 protein [bacterium]|nr:glycosyltransferase family 4 protein [bacterium]